MMAEKQGVWFNVGDYLIVKSNQGSPINSSNSGRLVGICKGHPLPLVVLIDSSAGPIAFGVKEVTAIKYDEVDLPRGPLN